jgi:hypothetical protein
MSSRLERDVRFLKVYAGVTTVALVALVASGFVQAPGRQKFQEIDVERINVVEPDGSYRMVIANKARSIGPIAYGKPFGYPGGNRPGIIFFNDEGTENGGLTFGGKKEPDGKFHAGGHLSFDQYNQDQVIYLTYADDNGRRRMGLTVADRADVPITDLVARMDSIKKLPEAEREAATRELMAPRNGVPMFAQRVYVGRDPAKAALLTLADPAGRVRIRIQVDSLGQAGLEFLDPAGKVTSRLP